MIRETNTHLTVITLLIGPRIVDQMFRFEMCLQSCHVIGNQDTWFTFIWFHCMSFFHMFMMLFKIRWLIFAFATVKIVMHFDNFFLFNHNNLLIMNRWIMVFHWINWQQFSFFTAILARCIQWNCILVWCQLGNDLFGQTNEYNFFTEFCWA